MTLWYVGRTQMGRASREGTLQLALQKLQHLFISIVFIGAHIDDETTFVRHYIMLRTTIDDSTLHLGITKEW